jgi:type III pantothenate kinase
MRVIKLNSETKVPFQNNYKTPKTLGVDRIALVTSSILKFPNKNVLIIDAGTCITYDFINKNNIYLGGAISPGLRLRYQSLNDLTANLPLLEIKRPKKVIGNTTISSIHSGVVLGTIYEIQGVIKVYSEKYSDLTVILTGGDAKMLSKQLKSSIFANSDFLLEGLNYILEFNSK